MTEKVGIASLITVGRGAAYSVARPRRRAPSLRRAASAQICTRGPKFRPEQGWSDRNRPLFKEFGRLSD